jgi:hypothetical protein
VTRTVGCTGLSCKCNRDPQLHRASLASAARASRARGPRHPSHPGSGRRTECRPRHIPDSVYRRTAHGAQSPAIEPLVGLVRRTCARTSHVSTYVARVKREVRFQGITPYSGRWPGGPECWRPKAARHPLPGNRSSRWTRVLDPRWGPQARAQSRSSLMLVLILGYELMYEPVLMPVLILGYELVLIPHTSMRSGMGLGPGLTSMRMRGPHHHLEGNEIPALRWVQY